MGNEESGQKTNFWRGRSVFVLVFLFGFLLVTFASWQLLSGWWEDKAARSEYAALREDVVISQLHAHQRMDMRHFIERNPDFVGWILIDGTPINYPVVQGTDNVKYLHTTFLGQSNPAGSIFMDYRAVQGFDTPLAIIYGHNMRDGSMFAPLHQFIDPEFSGDYPEITIINTNGEVLTYQVFEVRGVGARDALYGLDPTDELVVAGFFANAPAEASRFLALSTCAPPPNHLSRRLLVFAAYVSE